MQAENQGSPRSMGLLHHLTRVTNFCLSFPSHPKPRWEWQRGRVLFPISKPPRFSLECFANAWEALRTTRSQEQQTNLVNGFLIICIPRESTYYILGLRSITKELSSHLFWDIFSHCSAGESQGETVHSSPSQSSDSGCNNSRRVSV